VSQLLSTMQVLHNNRIVHRDIRPDNLLFSKQDVNGHGVNRLLLIDWAFAWFRDDPAVYMGATNFVSPAVREHMRARMLNPSATHRFTAEDDLYSWLLVCLAMANWAHFADELARLEVMFPAAKDIAEKQAAAALLFEMYLATPSWSPLREAVKRKIDVGNKARLDGVDYTVDYSDLHAFIPLNEQLWWDYE
jgi:serine/threonine protein kinase